jgi:hypothetical protein
VENEGQKWPGETARDELEILGTMDTTMIELMYRKDMACLGNDRKQRS